MQLFKISCSQKYIKESCSRALVNISLSLTLSEASKVSSPRSCRSINLKSSENAYVSGTFTDEFIRSFEEYKKFAACSLFSELSTRTKVLSSALIRKYFLVLASSLSGSKLKFCVPITLLNQSDISFKSLFNSL